MPVKKVCSVCKQDQKAVGPLFMHNVANGKVCQSCAEAAVALFTVRDSASPVPNLRIPRPQDLFDHLGQYVIGQDEAKIDLCIAVVQHYERLTDRQQDDVELEKGNVLMIGPSGSGKTYLLRCMAKKLNVPFAIGDATSLTEAGYVGEDVENLLLKLLRAADNNIEAAQRGILYVDEIDKIRSTGGNVSISRDVGGQGVQQSLLKMLEGTIANVPPHGGRKHPEAMFTQFDTKNVLFVCGGAFVGLEDIVAQRLGRRKIGFNMDAISSHVEREELLAQVRPEDLIRFGMIPEFVGRLPIITTLQHLNEVALKRILVEPKNSLLKQYAKRFKLKGAYLDFTDEAALEVAKLAIEQQGEDTGARALQSVMARVFRKILFASPEKGHHYVVTPEVVRGEQALGCLDAA